MNTQSIKRSLTRVITVAAVAAAVTGGTATVAHASAPAPSSPQGAVAPKAGPSGLPATFPTWGWGPTTICIKNVGGDYGTALLTPPYGVYNVAPGEEVCRSAWAFGALILALNISPSHTALEGRSF